MKSDSLDPAELEAATRERVAQAQVDIAYVTQGDYMLPTSEDMLGSKTYWLEMSRGLKEALGTDHPATKEAERIFDVLDNNGTVRKETLAGFKDLVNTKTAA